jgi:hypothetical protein
MGWAQAFVFYHPFSACVPSFHLFALLMEQYLCYVCYYVLFVLACGRIFTLCYETYLYGCAMDFRIHDILILGISL